MATAQPALPRSKVSGPAAQRKPRRAHLLGIAGAGMRALADVLLGRGWTLSGSDLDPGSAGGLIEAGVRVFQGHARNNLSPGTELVVYSDAVPAENPELRRAAELGIPRFSYFQMVGMLMSAGRGLAVAGTHGKSTTTAMAADVLICSGADPTVLYGATPLGGTSGGRPGSGRLVLAEACEYRANFLHLRPQQAVILGIEPDHFDYYRTAGELEDAFRRFARSVPPEGLVLARHDCPATRRITRDLPCRVETFGIHGGADWSVRSLTSRPGRCGFAIWRHSRLVCRVVLQVPGRHNVLNALAAAALALNNGVAPETIGRALGHFRGLHRRFEQLGTWRGALLVDDYAHHPTEVAAALATAGRLRSSRSTPGGRLWCVFQPHQVSRTERLMDELAESLQNADRVMVAEIFRAREGPPRPGEVTAADLARRVRRQGVTVPPLHRIDQIVRLLQTDLAPGDVLITMGAGDIAKIHAGLGNGVGADFCRFQRQDRAILPELDLPSGKNETRPHFQKGF